MSDNNQAKQTSPQKTEQEDQLADKQLARRIISYVDGLSKSNLNWFWQLFANALDQAQSENTLDIKINFKETSVEFSHSGKMFTSDNLLSIVNQSTTKNQELGFGLMSVYAMTSNVQVQGILLKQGQKREFSLELQRPIDSVNKLAIQIRQSRVSLNNLPPIKQTQPLDKKMTTRFRLIISKSFQQEIKIIKSNILLLFAFNKQLSSIEIVEKGKSVLFEKPPLSNNSLGCKLMCLQIPGIQTDGLLFQQQKNTCVAVPIKRQENSNILQRVESSIFKKYQLQQPHKIPFLISSNNFKLDTTRLKLKEKENENENEKILVDAFELFKKFLPKVIQTLDKREQFLSIDLKKEYNMIQKQYQKFISSQAIIKSSEKQYKQLSSVQFPVIQSSNYVPEKFLQQSYKFFQFCNPFLDIPLDPHSYKQSLQRVFQSLNNWVVNFKPFELKHFIQMLPSISLNTLIEGIQSIPQYSKMSKQHLITQFLNNFYAFLKKQFPYELVNPLNKIVINRNNTFVKLKGLLQTQDTIQQPYIKFLYEEANIDLKKNLLKEGIDKDVFDLDIYKIEDLEKLILEIFTQEELTDEDARKLFRFLSIYPKADPSNNQTIHVKLRSNIHQVLRHLRIFKNIPEQFTQKSLNIDYQPLTKRMIDWSFQKVEHNLTNLQNLGQMLILEKQDDVISWFNSFQQILNKINYQHNFSKNLNRNKIFQNCDVLHVGDMYITENEIKLFENLPVEIVIQGQSESVKFGKLGNVLLNQKINYRSFSVQDIKQLTIQQLLDSLTSKFEQENIEANKQRSQMILDYCDDLHEEYEENQSKQIQIKIQQMKDVRSQTSKALNILRLTQEKDKEFIWRLMKNKDLWQRFKQLVRFMDLSTIIKNSNSFKSIEDQNRRNQAQINKLLENFTKMQKDYNDKIEATTNKMKSEISNLEKKNNALVTQKQQISKKLSDLNEESSKSIQQFKLSNQKQITLRAQLKQASQKNEENEKLLKSSKEQVNQSKIQLQKKSKEFQEAQNRILQSKDKQLNQKKEQIKMLHERLQQMQKRINQNRTLSSDINNLEDKNDNLQKQVQKQKLKDEQETIPKPQKLSKQQKQDNRPIEIEVSSKQEQLPEMQLKKQPQQPNASSPSQHKISKSPQDVQEKSKQEQIFQNVSSEYKYDSDMKCFSKTSEGSGSTFYLMIFTEDGRNKYISHNILSKIYKIKTQLYIGFVPRGVDKNEFLDKIQIYRLQETGIDKHYSNLKDAQSKKNAAVKAKAGNGGFWFQYLVNPSLQKNIKPKSFQQFKSETSKS